MSYEWRRGSESLEFGLFSGVFPHIISVNKGNPAIPNLTGFNQFGARFGAHRRAVFPELRRPPIAKHVATERLNWQTMIAARFNPRSKVSRDGQFERQRLLRV